MQCSERKRSPRLARKTAYQRIGATGRNPEMYSFFSLLTQMDILGLSGTKGSSLDFGAPSTGKLQRWEKIALPTLSFPSQEEHQSIATCQEQ